MQTVLILGATSDVAKALSYAYAAKGWAVQLAGRNPSQLNVLQTDLSIRYNVPVSSHVFDASNPQQINDVFGAINPLPDVAICVFGHLGENEKSMSDWNETRRVLDANYNGAVAICNLLALRFAERGNGILVGISSVAGERGRQSNFIYGSAKAGFTAYLQGLRNWGFHRGIHVLTVKPGFIYTRMTENMKLPNLLTATPELVAKKVMGAASKKKNVIYVKWFWRYIMLLIKMIPEGVFKKMKM